MIENFSAEVFISTLALVGAVILVGALLSGFIERSGVPQVAVLLGLGAVLGPAGLGLLEINLDSPILRTVATLSLVLVLFTDALTIDLREVRQHSLLTMIVVGPGTLISAALVGLAGWGLLGLAPAAAAILGASLSSTDPVLLRGLLRRRDVPPATRQALRLESGLNDVVLLPVVLVAMALLEPGTERTATDWAQMAINLLLLGPGAGVIIGLLAVATLDLVRRRFGVRRDYESLYALGIAFTAYAAAEALHGSGLLAAFAAGLTISALDVELCDCFLEYGETTAELALLFTFVLFGSSLIWSGFAILSWPVVLFALLSLLVRPVAFLASLARLRLARKERWLIAWFGPRGLSSLLLVLLPVFAGLPGAPELFAVCCLVVLLSVVIHGGSPLVLARWKDRQTVAAAFPIAPAVTTQIAEQPTPAPPGQPVEQTEAQEQLAGDRERISLEQVQVLRAAGEPLYMLDVRSERSYARSMQQISGAIRMLPDHVTERAAEFGLPKEAWLITYCT